MYLTQVYLSDEVMTETKRDVMYVLCPATRNLPKYYFWERAVHLKMQHGRVPLVA